MFRFKTKNKFNSKVQFFAFSGLLLALATIFTFIRIPFFSNYLTFEISDLFVLFPFMFLKLKLALKSAITIGIIKNLFNMLINYWSGFWPGHLSNILDTLLLVFLIFIIFFIFKKNNRQMVFLDYLLIIIFINTLMLGFNLFNNYFWVINEYYSILGIKLESTFFITQILILTLFNIFKYSIIIGLFLIIKIYFENIKYIKIKH